MPRKTHQQEHMRKKAIKSGLKDERQHPHFEKEEAIVVTKEILPFILTHFFPNDKQKIIRRFLHELRSDQKKRTKKHAKRADSLEEAGCYRDEHAFHNTHEKIQNNRTSSGMAKSKKLTTYMTTHKETPNGKKKR
ncbi:MAG: hypothetical protein ACOYL1_03960 [Chlamydiia bacterium]